MFLEYDRPGSGSERGSEVAPDLPFAVNHSVRAQSGQRGRARGRVSRRDEVEDQEVSMFHASNYEEGSHQSCSRASDWGLDSWD